MGLAWAIGSMLWRGLTFVLRRTFISQWLDLPSLGSRSNKLEMVLMYRVSEQTTNKANKRKLWNYNVHCNLLGQSQQVLLITIHSRVSTTSNVCVHRQNEGFKFPVTNQFLPQYLLSRQVLKPLHGLARTEYPPALGTPTWNSLPKYRQLWTCEAGWCPEINSHCSGFPYCSGKGRGCQIPGSQAHQMLTSQYPTLPFISENLKDSK